MTFFLFSLHVATAVGLNDADLVTIINDNIRILMNEFLK